MNNIEFFYCYNKRLSDHIGKSGIKFVTVAINPNDGRTYSQYIITPELKKVIDDYKAIRQREREAV